MQRRHLGERLGTQPPACFGPPVLALPLCLDAGFLALERIAFNAGSLTCSIIMAREDWVRIAEPEVFAFARSG